MTASTPEDSVPGLSDARSAFTLSKEDELILRTPSMMLSGEQDTGATSAAFSADTWRLCWLADILARIVGHPAKKIDELLPWNWQESRKNAQAQ